MYINVTICVYIFPYTYTYLCIYICIYSNMYVRKSLRVHKRKQKPFLPSFLPRKNISLTHGWSTKQIANANSSVQLPVEATNYSQSLLKLKESTKIDARNEMNSKQKHWLLLFHTYTRTGIYIHIYVYKNIFCMKSLVKLTQMEQLCGRTNLLLTGIWIE